MSARRWIPLHLILAAVVTAGPALAQRYDEPSGRKDRSDQREWRGDRDHRDDDRDDDKRDDRPGHHDDDDGMMPHGRMHEKGAAFFLRHGDARFAVKCPASESMRSCVDAALSLMDKAKSLQPSPTAPQPGGQ